MECYKWFKIVKKKDCLLSRIRNRNKSLYYIRKKYQGSDKLKIKNKGTKFFGLNDKNECVIKERYLCIQFIMHK